MKAIITYLIFFIIKLNLYSQDTINCPIGEFGYPFEHLNDSVLTISIPKTYFRIETKSVVIAELLVKESGLITNSFIRAVRLKDSSSSNAVLYVNNNPNIANLPLMGNETLADKYPGYVRYIITKVFDRINEIKFKSKHEALEKRFYNFAVMFKVTN